MRRSHGTVSGCEVLEKNDYFCGAVSDHRAQRMAREAMCGPATEERRACVITGGTVCSYHERVLAWYYDV